jgi:hypothetical protein
MHINMGVISRRDFLKGLVASAALTALPRALGDDQIKEFRYDFNQATQAGASYMEARQLYGAFNAQRGYDGALVTAALEYASEEQRALKMGQTPNPRQIIQDLTSYHCSSCNRAA